MATLKWTALAGIVLVVSMNSGCAFVGQKIPLEYQNTVYDGNHVQGGAVAVVVPAEPEMKRKKNNNYVIGTVKNSYGMKTADVTTKDSVSAWVANALKKELDSVGFNASIVKSATETTENVVETRIIKVWVDQDPGFWTVGAIGEVQLRIVLYHKGNRMKEFDVESRGQGDRSMISTAGTKEESMMIALEACMKKTIPIIVETFSPETQ